MVYRSVAHVWTPTRHRTAVPGEGGLWRREESWGERAGGNQVEAGGAMRLLDSETTAASSIPGDGKTGIVEIDPTK